MQHTSGWRRLAVYISAVAASAAGVVAVPGTAHAYVNWMTRYEDTSEHDTVWTKEAVAECPEGQLVHSAGGRITDGGGKVVLTAVIPDSTLTTVTARGAARSPVFGGWSVTAFAVCVDPEVRWTSPVRVASPYLGATTTASCTGGKLLTGAGFDLQNAPAEAYVDRVEPNAAITSVTVHAESDLLFVNLRAYGICVETFNLAGAYLQDAETNFDTVSPKTAVTATDPDVGSSPTLLSLGGEVSGGEGTVMIEAFGSTNDILGASARFAYVGPAFVAIPRDPGLPWRPAALAGTDDDEEDYSGIVYALRADWY